VAIAATSDSFWKIGIVGPNPPLGQQVIYLLPNSESTAMTN